MATWRDFVKIAAAIGGAVSFSKDGRTFTLPHGKTPTHAVQEWNKAHPDAKISVRQILDANKGVAQNRFRAGKAYPMPQSSRTPKRSAVDIATDFIAKHEGFRGNAYRDPITGVPTVGHGHTEIVDSKTGKPRPVAMGDTMSKADSMAAIKRIAERNERRIAAMPWARGLGEGYRAAMLDTMHNLGPYVFGDRRSPGLNREVAVPGADVAAILRRHLPTYRKAGGKVVPGLQKRREEAVAQLLGA